MRVGGPTGAVAAGAGAVWVLLPDDDKVVRLNPDTGQVTGAAIPVGDGPLEIAVGAGAVWVTNIDDNTVTRINL